MTMTSLPIRDSRPRLYTKATLIKPAAVDCVDLAGQTFSITALGKRLRHGQAPVFPPHSARAHDRRLLSRRDDRLHHALGGAGRFGITGQIIASLKHRDKAPNNALVAKAVEVCARRGLDHLVYLFWSDDSLAEFKRRCGFERTRVPRYYVPLTRKGHWGLRWGLHRGWKQMVPRRIKVPLKRLRRLWY